MIRLIASDVDGTLVKDGSGVINPEYYDVISRLREKGIIVCIASGRQFASIERLFQPISDKLLYIAEGGAILRSPDEIYHMETIPSELISEFLEDCRNCTGTDRMMATPDITYTETGSDTPLYHFLADSYGFTLKNVDSLDSICTDQVVKISLFHETDAEGLCRHSLIPKWQDKLQMVCAGSQWVDSLSLNTSKGNALAALQKRLLRYNVTKQRRKK